jgi:hypothetical protein
MDLLGHVWLERKCRDLGRLDLREATENRAAQSLRLHRRRIAEADVDGQRLEPPTRTVRRDVVAHGGTFEQLVELRGPHDGESEVAAQVDLLRRDKIIGGRPLVIPAAEVHILRRAKSRPEAKVERECALEDAPVGRHGHQMRQQPFERDELAQPYQRNAVLP